MRTFAQKPKASEQATPAKSTIPGRAHFGQSREVSPTLQLQRSIGNHAVGRLLQAHAQELEDQSPTGALPRFSHDFSRIPVRADEPTNDQKQSDRTSRSATGTAFNSRSLADISAFPPRSASDNAETHAVGQEEGRRNGAFVDVRGLAARGLGGAGAPLPHLDRIQSSFGRHDVTGTRAHLGPEAADANRRMGAAAYTFGDRVAFAGLPNLHTAAHEAAHLVQQRSGVQVKNNLGEPGDAYEKHADAVAFLVVQGKHAEPLLDQMAGPAASHGTGAAGAGVMQKAAAAVQMQPTAKSTTPQMFAQIPGFQESIAKWLAIDKVKSPLVRALAKEYVNRPGQLEPRDWVRLNSRGNVMLSPAIQPRTEDRVFDALYPAMDLKKTGKGDKPTDWSLQWANEPAAPQQQKTAGTKAMEVGKFATEHAIELGNPALDLGVEYALTGEVSILEPAAEWIITDVLKVSAKVATKAMSIIGLFWLAYDVADLLISLNAPAEKELSPNQRESASIVAGVKAYLEGKKRAAEPLAASNIILQNDKTMVQLPRQE